MSGHAYPFDTADPAERRRLDAHAELWDPSTFRTLTATGVGPGRRCLEVGAGTGTVAAWLRERVGAEGLVVATDREPRWLEPLAGRNLVVLAHDVHDDPIDPDGYDLVHARLLLEHLPERDAVVAKLVAALRPGGWLVIEDYDTRTMAFADPPHDAWTACALAVPQVMRQAGSDPTCGARLVGILRRAGLVDVAGEGHLRLAPVPDLAPVFRPPLEVLRRPLVDSGAVTAAQVDAALAAFDAGVDPPTTTYTPVLVAASGRRPA